MAPTPPSESGAQPIDTIRLNDVRKVYAEQPALRGISFTLNKGAPAVIVGPNGAGKSTLLAILSTLSRPTSGTVHFGPHDHRYVENHLRHRIGLISHSPMLYRHMTGRENLAFFARLQGVRTPDQATAQWLERVGMAGHADRPVQQLSRGMIQRITLARALLSDPDVLLLDEPFTGLDSEAVDLLRRAIHSAAHRGRVVAVVSHDAEALDGLCGQLLVLKRGTLVEEQQQPELSAATIKERIHALR